MNLGEFIDTYRDAITERVIASYPPTYSPTTDQRSMPRLLRQPRGAQEDAIRGASPDPRRRATAPPGNC